MPKRTLVIYVVLLGIGTYRFITVCGAKFLACGDEVIAKSTFLSSYKTNLEDELLVYLPSPHRELLVGMTIGDDLFNQVPVFKQKLKDTGTIHVVVVSGFNISLVFNLIIRLLGSPYVKRNVVLAFGATFFYALLSGFEPPVIRSWIMGSIISLGKYYGRKINVYQVLFFSALVMVILNPVYAFSISFQLSFIATLSLVMFSEPITNLFKNSKNLLIQDLSSTLAAQVLIWPYLSYKFNTLSLISPLVNMLVLWTVPLATVVGGMFICATYISSSLASIVAPAIFLPLDYFVTLVDIFSKFGFASIDYSISLPVLISYYIVVCLLGRAKKDDAR